MDNITILEILAAIGLFLILLGINSFGKKFRIKKRKTKQESNKILSPSDFKIARIPSIEKYIATLNGEACKLTVTGFALKVPVDKITMSCTFDSKEQVRDFISKWIAAYTTKIVYLEDKV